MFHLRTSFCQKLSRPGGNFVPIKQRDMKLIDFMQVFPDEGSCERKLREYRETQGVVCPHCGCKEHYWKGDKKCFECKHCHYRQSQKANTVMHGSQLPLRYWFITMHLLTSTKKSFSAAELQRQLGHKNYMPIWAMLHKLRNAMGKRDAEYKVCGMVELDEGFFSTEALDSEKDKPLKRGHGSQKKSKVLVLAETDDSKSYTNFKSLVEEHVHQVIEPVQVGKILPWVHIATSNAKRLLLDVYHEITPGYLQNYLNEFCYKFNRRRFGNALLDKLMVAALA